MNDSLRCTVKAPNLCTAAEIEAFLGLVTAGREVDPVGLPNRVKAAHTLAFLRENDSLIGVAGLKYPTRNHRRIVQEESGVPLHPAEFPLELGWVFVIPTARGGKSYLLCAPLLARAASTGVFATSRAGNQPMHATLAKVGFTRAGEPWASGQNPDSLWLFVKAASSRGVVDRVRTK